MVLYIPAFGDGDGNIPDCDIVVRAEVRSLNSFLVTFRDGHQQVRTGFELRGHSGGELQALTALWRKHGLPRPQPKWQHASSSAEGKSGSEETTPPSATSPKPSENPFAAMADDDDDDSENADSSVDGAGVGSEVPTRSSRKKHKRQRIRAAEAASQTSPPREEEASKLR
jgi:hypothetical protein